MSPTQSNLLSYTISETARIKDALRLIESNQGKIVLIVDSQQRLLGTVTDGDIRRGLLEGYDTSTPAVMVMNKEPFFIYQDEQPVHLFPIMQAKHIRNIPIVNRDGQVVELVHMTEILVPKEKENWVIIMAGGFGKRLYPLTSSMPKPMLEIGGSPVLEHLIGSFVAQGFRKFYISVHYLADKIKAHFGDGSSRNITIRYIEEDQPLGTAGALSLLSERPENSFLVINGDILTNAHFSNMLDFHVSSNAIGTMGVREHKVQIPYGIVEIDKSEIREFSEKPEKTFLVNTGIYVLEPKILDLVAKDKALNMPDLFKRAQLKKQNIMAFPITEYWLDIGRLEDFAIAEDMVRKIGSST